MPIHLAIAEDNSFALKALQDRLAAWPDLAVRHVARNGKELLQQLSRNAEVDVILMDIEMPEMNGIDATSAVKERYPQIRVIMLTMYDDEDLLFKAVMAGASGYLLKEDNAGQLRQSIGDAMSGGAAMSPAMAMKTLRLIRSPRESGQEVKEYGLTEREIELLTQLKNGLTYEAIAVNLHISYHTVRKHIENIYRKLQVSNKVSAIKKASDNRLV